MYGYSSHTSSKFPTKVVVRRLPPCLNIEEFLTIVSPIPRHNYIYLTNPTNEDGVVCFSTVYINFLKPEDVYAFKQKFDNYVFVGKSGTQKTKAKTYRYKISLLGLEYSAIVEYAPYQKISKTGKFNTTDFACNTIENTEYYKSFLENKKSKEKEIVKRTEYNYELKNSTKAERMTPLLKFVIENRQSQHANSKNRHVPKKKCGANSIVFTNSTARRNHRKNV